MIKDQLQQILDEHCEAAEKSFDSDCLQVLERITREVLKSLKGEGKILLCGNGGSAADSQHIAAEFIARFKQDRRSLPALALTTDTSILTAVANDYAYDKIFSRQIEGLGRKGDILFAISTSGNSKNVLRAVQQAKSQEIFTVGFTGKDGGELKKRAGLCFQAKSRKTSHIQEIHVTVLHAISEAVENVLFGT